MITELKPWQVFVYGSNEAGINGAGAARQAQQKFGARHGVRFGHSGQSFAIPTKDMRIQTLPLDDINRYVEAFLWYCAMFPDTEFLVTAIGCGLAGYTPKDIAPMFLDSSPNVKLPPEFIAELKDALPT